MKQLVIVDDLHVPAWRCVGAKDLEEAFAMPKRPRTTLPPGKYVVMDAAEVEDPTGLGLRPQLVRRDRKTDDTFVIFAEDVRVAEEERQFVADARARGLEGDELVLAIAERFGWQSENCSDCNASGKDKDGAECATCDGEGAVVSTEHTRRFRPPEKVEISHHDFTKAWFSGDETFEEFVAILRAKADYYEKVASRGGHDLQIDGANVIYSVKGHECTEEEFDAGADCAICMNDDWMNR